MGYAIIRMQKLKAAVAVRRSMQHAFREQDTPNADPAKLRDNTVIGAANSREALQRFSELLPDKVRKNAVLAVEYLVTASPEAMRSKSQREQDDYFRDALKWLEAKHGKENVIHAGIHRDETTPHLYAYVVPLDGRGHLNCRAFYGEKDALSKMQTDFADKVGKVHGLERGLEGSRARHTEIRRYYAKVTEKTPPMPSIDVPEGGLLETKRAYGQRVAQAVLDQVRPKLDALAAKAQQFGLTEQKAKSMESTAKHAIEQAATHERTLRDRDKKTLGLMQMIAKGGEPLTKLQADLRRDLAKQKTQERDTGHEPER